MPVYVGQLVAILSWIYLGLGLILIARMQILGLWQRFPFFVLDVAIGKLVLISGFVAGFESRLYCSVYLWSRLLVLAFLPLICREVYSPLYGRYPGLRALSQGSFRLAVVSGVIFAMLAVPATISRWSCANFQCFTSYVVEVKRFLWVTLSLYLLVMSVRLPRIKIEIPWNTRLHSRILAITWPIQITLDALAVTFHHQINWVLPVVNLVLLIVAGVSFGSWILWLRTEADSSPVAESRAWDLESTLKLRGTVENLSILVAEVKCSLMDLRRNRRRILATERRREVL